MTNKKLLHRAVWLLALVTGLPAVAQVPDTATVSAMHLSIDSAVVHSSFDVARFIERVRKDTTFYKAFKSLHFIACHATNHITAFGSRGDTAAFYYSRTHQLIEGNCRRTEVTDSASGGDFYRRNGDYTYYTARMFDHLFFAKEPRCNESDIVGTGIAPAGAGPLEKSEYQLKQLIFNPGSKVSGVPFLGARPSIFDPGESEKYTFHIRRDTVEGIACYLLSIRPAPGHEHSVLYNELDTWFRLPDYSIVARNYSLSYHTLVYDFDVQMQVGTTMRDGRLYPVYISYNGDWHIALRRRERVRFTTHISY